MQDFHNGFYSNEVIDECFFFGVLMPIAELNIVELKCTYFAYCLAFSISFGIFNTFTKSIDSLIPSVTISLLF